MHMQRPPPATHAPGRQLFQEALTDGTMNGFFKLMEQFRYIHNHDYS